jgi:hypothetical protein
MDKIRVLSFLLLALFAQTTWAQKKSKPLPAAAKELKATVSLDKTNVLYVGVPNPIAVSAGTASIAEITMTCKKGAVVPNEAGQQTLVCTKPGLDTLIVVAPDGSVGKFNFKIKKLPDPTPKLNGQHVSGSISAEDLKACNEIKPVFDNFGFEPKCTISGFNFSYIPKKQDPVSLVATNPKFDVKIAEQIVKGKPGDYFMFSNISAKCQGDVTPRILAPLVFLIK